MKELPGINNVPKLLGSENSRTNRTPKLQQLMCLHNQFLGSRLEHFHCNINNSIELHCIGKYFREEMFIEANRKMAKKLCLSKVHSDCDHITSFFGPLVSNLSSKRRFILDWKCSQLNFLFKWKGYNACSLLVWNAREVKWTPWKVQSSLAPLQKKSKSETMVDFGPSGAVVVRFLSLKRNRMFPAAFQTFHPRQYVNYLKFGSGSNRYKGLQADAPVGIAKSIVRV